MKSIGTDGMKEAFLLFLKDQLTLSEKEKQAILEIPLFRTFPKGTILFHQGDFTKEYYFVIQGGIRTYLLVDGNDITTAFYTENEALIPLSTAIKEPSQCYAVCFEDSIVVVSSEDVEQEVFRHIPEFESVCRKFSEKLLARNLHSSVMSRTLTPEQRYLQLVKERPGLIQRIPQYHLASYLGIRPESLSRIRKRLAQKKISRRS